MENDLKFQTVVKLSLIGGLSGGIWRLVAYIISLVGPISSLILNFALGGIGFSIVGVGVALSYIISLPQLHKREKKSLLVAGIIGGFCAGLFFHFGMLITVGMAFIPASIAISMKAQKIPQAGKFFFCGVLGGLIGTSLASIIVIGMSSMGFSHFISHDDASVIATILYVPVIAYFMNLGFLLPLVKRQV